MAALPAASPPTLAQVLALTHCYRRLFVLWWSFPLASIWVPWTVRFIWALLHIITAGNIGPVLLLTVLLTTACFQAVYHWAPLTPREKIQPALEREKFRLVLVCWVVSTLLVRFLTAGQPAPWQGLDQRTFPSIRLTWGFTVRLAAWWLLLGLALLGRYVGPQSIMRCSAMPLVYNPLERALVAFLQNPASILEPGDTPDQLLTYPMQTNPIPGRHGGRRFRRPTVGTVAVQILMAVLMGMLVAVTVVLPWSFQQGVRHEYTRLALATSCVMTLLANLLSVFLSYTHEIDVTRYLDHTRPNSAFDFLSIPFSTLLKEAVVGPLIAMVMAHVLAQDAVDVSLREYGLLYAILLGSSLLSGGYLFALDEAVRRQLFHPPVDLQQLVQEFDDDGDWPVAQLHVVIHILLNNDQMVQEVFMPLAPTSSHIPMEVEERRRVDKLCKELADQLLTFDRHRQEAPLEEDVLRIVILDSLGGNDANLSRRNLTTWLGWEPPKGATHRTPLLLTLLRSLCVFSKGLGESIRLCQSPLNRAQTAHSPTMRPWLLPPAFLTSAELAANAAKNCIVLSLESHKEKDHLDWENTHLIILIPTTLDALYHLRMNLSTMSSQIPPSLTNGQASSRESFTSAPGILRSIRACEEAGALILQALNRKQGRLDFHLEKDCLSWIQGLSPPMNGHRQASFL